MRYAHDCQTVDSFIELAIQKMSSSLPSDIVTEILSRLPGKTLLRFRSVSKEFNSLISGHHFLRLHHRRSLNSLFVLHALSHSRHNHLFQFANVRLFLTDDDNNFIYEFVKQFDDFAFRIYPSYHQFICFSCRHKIFLCDPNRSKFLQLPNPSSSSAMFNCFITFGFVSSTFQYKLIKWNPNYHNNDIIESEILTVSVTEDDGGRLAISPWRSSRFHCPYPLEFSSSVHVEGVLFWKTTDFRIVSFSLQYERFSLLQSSPPCFSDQVHHQFELSGIRGNLHVIEYDSQKPSMEIWVLRESWEKIHRIDLRETPELSPEKAVEGVYPIHMVDIRREGVLFQVMYPSSRIKAYDAETKRVEDYGEVDGKLQLSHYTDGTLSLDHVVFL